MSEPPAKPPDLGLVCGKCGQALESGRVTVTYLGNRFPVELPRCVACNLVFVPEALALGKMLQVEQALEDK